MKKRFLPFSLLLVIMILGQAVMADEGGHYVPRAKGTTSAEAFIASMRVNQNTGLIDPAWMIAASKETTTRAKGAVTDPLYWISMGPNNLGGRTTSVIYNNQRKNEVFIGSMGGGVYHTTNKGISWHQIGGNLLVSCMAQAEDGTIYVGTGDRGCAYDFNGLGDMDYTNSFIGSGIYTISKDRVMSDTPLEGTTPTIQNDVAEWSYINDIIVDGQTIIAATNDGLRYRSLKGAGEWSYAMADTNELVGDATKVMVSSDHTIWASVDGKLYSGQLDNMVCFSGESAEEMDTLNNIIRIAPAPSEGVLDFTFAPTDENVIYAVVIKANGEHQKFYGSIDRGATWTEIFPAVSSSSSYNFYNSNGIYHHGLLVDPENAKRLYVFSEVIWRLDVPETGYSVAIPLTSAGLLHGINDFVFDPYNTKKGYVGTDGGIFQFEVSSDDNLSFVNCNRGNITTRCLTVAPGINPTRVMAGTLEHGPILIKGLANTNTLQTADLLDASSISAVYTVPFSEAYTCGASVVSSICPNTLIFTTKDGGIYRTENAGEDYDASNFTANQSFTFTGYRMPIALWESFDDENSVDSIWFKCTEDMSANDTLQFFSHNGEYPYNFVLTNNMHFDTINPDESDSVLVMDPVTAKLFVPCTSGNKHKIFVTFDALQFNKAAEWNSVATFSAIPTCLEISSDGDVLYVGTKQGKLFRVGNLKAVVDVNTANETTAVLTEIPLPITNQCITSVSVLPEDNNKVVVTLGNYGNESYVLYSTNAMDSLPDFETRQGDLKLMPVYSSIYTLYHYVDVETGVEKVEEHVLLGTERGVYKTANIDDESPVWVAENTHIGEIPVLEMKQQILSQPDQYVSVTIDEVPTTKVIPGITNTGMVYIATYGAGLFRCENYHVFYAASSVPETPNAVAQNQVNMYPNPVRDEARVSFELNGNGSVSYQVYDMSGRMVKTENKGNFGEGKHEINVSVDGLATGAYVLRLSAGSQTSTVKFMVY